VQFVLNYVTIIDAFTQSLKVGDSFWGFYQYYFSHFCEAQNRSQPSENQKISQFIIQLSSVSNRSVIIEIQGGTQNDPVFDLLIKSLFQLQY
jgi:hypothetical protein